MKNRLLLSLLTTCVNCYLALETILAVYCEAALKNGRIISCILTHVELVTMKKQIKFP